MPRPEYIDKTEALRSGNYSFFYDESTRFVNVYPCKVLFEGVFYKSAEHAYHANKFCINSKPIEGCEKIFKSIIDVDSPIKAKEIAHKYVYKIRPDWESIKLKTMIKIICAKMCQHPDIAQELIDTHPNYLVEDVPSNASRDDFWGMNNSNGFLTGNNAMGRILMTVRLMLIRKQLDEIKAKETVYFVEQ